MDNFLRDRRRDEQVGPNYRLTDYGSLERSERRIDEIEENRGAFTSKSLFVPFVRSAEFFGFTKITS